MSAAFLVSLAAVAALRAPLPRAPAPRCTMSEPSGEPTSTKQLYAHIDYVLRRARERSPMGARYAKSIGNRWLEMAPEDLVEATLVSGATVLQSADEGFEILREAEEGASLTISPTAYSALMGMAQSEQRPADALALLARARAYAVPPSDGMLLSAMRAAAAIGDWGAVARLHVEMAEGDAASARFAMELETFADDRTLQELRNSSAWGPAISLDNPGENELAETLHLALRAHCERGDVTRTAQLVARMRARGVALDADEYTRLARLAYDSNSAELLTHLQKEDLQRSLVAQVEPRVLRARNRLGIAAASLGRYERVAVAVVLAVYFLASLGLLASGSPGASSIEVDSLASMQDGLY